MWTQVCKAFARTQELVAKMQLYFCKRVEKTKSMSFWLTANAIRYRIYIRTYVLIWFVQEVLK